MAVARKSAFVGNARLTAGGVSRSRTVGDLTMKEVANRAKVGKPTLYKWWPTKAALVLALLCERMVPNLDRPSGGPLKSLCGFECGA
jgi:hypothetical protein